MTVHYDVEGPVAIVTIDRPEARNAVDRPTADALVDAFTRFDADDRLAVAVLTGAHGTFCAGADLKAMAEPGGARVNRVALDGDGPMGPTRLLLRKPVIEVHLTNIHQRPAPYTHSLVSLAATGVICGLGPTGYLLAVRAVADALSSSPRSSGT